MTGDLYLNIFLILTSFIVDISNDNKVIVYIKLQFDLISSKHIYTDYSHISVIQRFSQEKNSLDKKPIQTEGK
jgi:hypothetical protein